MQTGTRSDTSEPAEYDEAVRFNPNSAEAYFNRGKARATQDQDPSAILDYDEALRLNPNFAEAYFFRAVIYRDMDEHDQATRDLKKAYELEPTNPVYRQAMKDRGYLE